MKRISLTIASLLMSSVALNAGTQTLTPKAEVLNQEIEALQKTLQDKVDAYNAELANGTSSQTSLSETSHLPSGVGTASGIPTQPLQVVEAPESALLKRIEALEHEVNTLKQGAAKPVIPLDGARTPEEAAATKKAVENAPLLAADTPAVAQYNQAFALLKNNELEKAAEAFKQILENYPNDPYAHKSQVHLGDIFRQLGKLDEAEKAYNLALTYNLEPPLMVECRLGLAETLIAFNKSQLACTQLEIVAKERIDETQKGRLQNALTKGECKKKA